MSRKKDNTLVALRGFTLIELMVVVTIIAIILAIVAASFSSARAKGRDSARMTDLAEVRMALELYYRKYNQYPASPNNIPYNHGADFNAVTNTLIAEGFLKKLPTDPLDRTVGGSPYDYAVGGEYWAWDYGAGTPQGLLIVVKLEAIDATTAPPSNTCRPFNNTNWCSSIVASKDYCLCHPY